MEENPSIASLVEKAIKTGLRPQLKRRSAKAARAAKLRARMVHYDPESGEDSDFDDFYMGDRLWEQMYKYEEEEFDQYIFHITRQDSIDTQERKVNVTWAVSIRDCPEKAKEIAMWKEKAESVISKAPKRHKKNKKKNTSLKKRSIESRIKLGS